MQTHDKETLISLSLAGTIGFYLFNKLSEASMRLGNETKEYGVEEFSQAAIEEVIAEPEELLEDKEIEETVEVPIEYYDEEDEPIEDPIEESFEELGDIQFEDEPAKTIAEDPMDDDVLNGLNDLLAEETTEAAVKETEVEAIAEPEPEPEPEPESVVFCPNCGTKNSKEFAFCHNCGNALVKQEPKEEAFTPFVESEFTPELDNPFGAFTQLPKAAPVEPVVEKPVQVEEPKSQPQSTSLDLSTEDIMDELNDMDDMDEIDDIMDDNVEDLFNTGLPTQAIMDNTEKLHKIDNGDASAKKEFKSIEDFFDTI